MNIRTSEAQVHPDDRTEPGKTAVSSTERDDMAEIFVKTMKRDYIIIRRGNGSKGPCGSV